MKKTWNVEFPSAGASSRRQVNFFISVAFEIVVSLVIESFPVDVISIELLSSEEFR